MESKLAQIPNGNEMGDHLILKPTSTQIASTISINFMALDSSTAEKDSEIWYIDKDATSHVINRIDLCQTFEYFTGVHIVTTANGSAVHAIGKENLEIEADVGGTKELITQNDIYVPFIKKDLFSVLSTQGRLQSTVLEFRIKMCLMKF